MKQTLARVVVWHGAEIAVQKAVRPDGSELFGFPGAVVIPGEQPEQVASADISRKLGVDFRPSFLGEGTVLESTGYQAYFYETNLQYDSIPKDVAARHMVRFWYLDQLQTALEDGLLAPLSAMYLKENL